MELTVKRKATFPALTSGTMELKSPLKPDPQLTDRSFCCQHRTVAQAFSTGAFNSLRGYCPTLPSEGAVTNSTPYQVMTGFAIEAKE